MAKNEMNASKLLLALFAGMSLLLLPACHKQEQGRESSPEMRECLSKLVPLQQVIVKYSEDSKTRRRTPVFPQTLNTLVEEGYLSSEELAKYTDVRHFHFFPPPDSSTAATCIFAWQVDNENWTFNLDGGSQGFAGPEPTYK